MALDAALDLGPVILFGVALGLTLLAIIVVRALTHPIGWLPVIGPGARQALTSALVTPLESLAGGLEGRIVAGLSRLLDDLAVLLAIPLLIGYGVYKGLHALWNVAIPSYVKAQLKPVEKVAHRALTLAHTAATDAAKALTKVESIHVPSVADVWRDVKDDVHRIASTAKHDAEKYASSAVKAVEAGPVEAAAKIGSIAATAEHDTAHAFARALAGAEGLAIPVGHDIGKLEDYIKGLGTAGLVAAVPTLAYLLQQVISDAGLSNAECRSKVGNICGVNTSAWLGLLESLAVVGIAFDLRELVKEANKLAGPVKVLLQEAA